MKAFPAIQIAGGLLGPELLEEVWKGEAEGQKPEDFGLKSSRRLLDEMSEAFTAAREWWGVFARSLEKEQDVSPARTAQEWLIPLLSRLGYEVQKHPASYELSGLRLEVSYWAGQPEEAPPIVLFGPAQPLDRLPPKGSIRLTPHTLLQEFLNRSEHLWGLVTNGRQLRLLRNSSYLRRQVYIEFDLEKTFAEGLFEDFQVLYRLVHRTRLPSSTTDPEKCYLERYYRLSIEQGGRVREKLREGVERAIILLAEGFLNHPANDALRTRLQSTLTPQDLYHELLRLVYRILFLLVAEARGLIGGEEAPLYLPYYSVSRLRRLIDKQDAYTEHDDLWCGLLVLWKVLADQDLARCLGLTALNGDLFKPILLDSCFVANRDLLRAFWHFLYYQDEAAKGLRRVNYLRLDVEELGSVYESLLDNTPEVGKAERRWTFGFRRGMDRKKTGSYYTPDELVTLVLKEALDPVVEERLRQAGPSPEAQERAILSLRILDPAAGSGHFLLGAARRLARRLAQIRTGVPDPPAEEYRRAIRDVVQHTLYAVDVNPLAVELCRVALWMESHVPGPPLTFLEHRIKLGNSLVGTLRPDVLAQGIPDEAYQPKATDNRETARLAKKTNQHARQGIQDIFNQLPQPQSALATQLEALTALPENTPEDIAQKAERYRAFQNAVHRLRLAADLWTAAFFQPLQPKKPLITTHHLRMLLHGGSLPPDVEAMVLTLSAKHHFFHWWLEFPDVMRHGGFDVVLGNPPWERIKLEDKQFFADKAPAIAQAENAAKRKRMITALEKENPALFQAYEEALTDAEAVSAFLRHSGRFPLTARGDINTYPLFAELGRSLLRPTGRLGLILPTGIATDDSNKHFFATVVDKRQLAALLDFENREGLFPAIDSRMKFSVFILRGRGAPDPAKLLFFATRAEQAEDPNRPFALSAEDFARLNPNTRTCPVFRTRHDADLTRAIYQRIPILWRENPEENPWRISFARLFDMANDSHLFRTGAELEAQGFTRVANRYERGSTAYLPLYEGKLLWHYDHRYATFAGGDSREVSPAEHARPDFLIRPRYWVPATEVEKRLADQTWERRWLIGFRKITNTTNERTIVAGLIPYAGVGHSALLLLAHQPGPQILALIANLTSLVLDYVARQKVGGTNLTFYHTKQFPVLPPDRYTAADFQFIVPRVLELVYTAWDMASLAQDVWAEADPALRTAIQAWLASAPCHPDTPPAWVAGPYPFPPFVWDEARRAILRAELDAYYAHLYGLTRKQLRYLLDPHDLTPGELRNILDPYEEVTDPLDEAAYRARTEKSAFPGETFRVLKEKELRQGAAYRTRRLVLEAWARLFVRA
jgi:hypothetical protein